MHDDLTALAGRLAAGETTAAQLADAALEVEDHLGALIDRNAAAAATAAAASDRRRAEGLARGVLDGIPVVIKGNIDVAGLATTAGTKAYRFPAASDAPVVAALRAAGAVVVATTNLAEGALGAVTDNPFYGQCRNPLDPTRTAGGSSGGSAAAVASGRVPLALGTDTMGSVRIPASYCGIVGLKPTWGALSTRGVVPLAPLLDTVGLLTRSVRDLRPVLAALEGPDPAWPWWRAAPQERPQVAALPKLGVPDFVEWTAPFERAVASIRDSGASVREDVPIPIDLGLVRRRGLLLCEAGGCVAHRDALVTGPEGFSDSFRGLLDFAKERTAPDLWAAMADLAEAGASVRLTLDDCDALLLPVTPSPAPLLGTDPPSAADYTAFVNVAGLPALALPSGLQLVGPPWGEPLLIALAERLEQVVA